LDSLNGMIAVRGERAQLGELPPSNLDLTAG
jgi:hypothetical protein